MRKLFASVVLALSVATLAFSQEFKTSYFFDNHVYNYRLNPAADLGGKPGFFFAVGLGNVSASLLTNLGYSSIAYPIDGQVYYAIDEHVSAEAFLANLDEQNLIQPLANVNILTIGKQTENSRFSFEVNLRSNSSLILSKDVASAVKKVLNELAAGTFKDPYEFTDWPGLSTRNYGELAFNFAHRIGDGLTVGGTIKGLAGLAGGNAYVNRLKFEPDAAGNYSGTLDADLLIASKLFNVPSGVYDGKNLYDFSQTGFGSVGISGLGAALDLGVNYDLGNGLSFGISVLDLGFINWNYNTVGKIDYSGREIHSSADALELQVKDSFSAASMLDYNVHAFAKYRMPFYDRLNVGLIGTWQSHFKEIRLGAGVTPLDFISIALSGAYNTYGLDFGAGLNLRFPGVNLFLGLDSVYFNMTNFFIPVDRGITNATVGLAIAF